MKQCKRIEQYEVRKIEKSPILVNGVVVCTKKKTITIGTTVVKDAKEKHKKVNSLNEKAEIDSRLFHFRHNNKTCIFFKNIINLLFVIQKFHVSLHLNFLAQKMHCFVPKAKKYKLCNQPIIR